MHQLTCLRNGLLLLAMSVACASSVAAVDDRFAMDPKLRRFVESMRGEIIAVELGRIAYRKRWNEVLTETLYQIAQRGTWNETHPAWPAAREALSDALRQESVRWLTANRDEVRLIVHEQSMQQMTEDERLRTAEFFESHGGRIWRDARETSARERAYGLPLVIEQESLARITQAHEAAQKALLALPENGDGKVVYDFLQSPLGKKLLDLQNEHWARIVANICDGELEAVVRDKKTALFSAVRSAVRDIPAASDKTYLGTATLGQNRAFTVVVEHYDALRLVGKYTLSYAPNDLHWNDIAAAVPGIKPGETRSIYRDAAGRLGDHP